MMPRTAIAWSTSVITTSTELPQAKVTKLLGVIGVIAFS